MGRLITSVPNMHHVVMVKGVRVLPGVRDVGVKGDKFIAVVDDDLTREAYETLSKQVRLIYGFSFQCSYSDNYSVSVSSGGFHFTGHDERKAHLLERPLFPTPNFMVVSGRILEDMLHAATPKQDVEVGLYNLVYLWVQARELRELHLVQEAEILYMQIIAQMKQEGSDAKAKKLLKKLRMGYSGPAMFGARVIANVGGDARTTVREEVQALSDLERAYEAQASNKSGALYLEETNQATEQRNSFMAEMTRLYILWRFGLDDYVIRQKGDSYRIAKKVRKTKNNN